MEEQKERREAYDFGEFAEELAAQEYIKNGYTVLERNWYLGKTEIDIIAQKDDVIVLAEVKARKNSESDALAAVTVDKRKRMIRAADNYLRRLRGNYDYRFDIVAVTGNIRNYQLEIFEDAFVAADLF